MDQPKTIAIKKSAVLELFYFLALNAVVILAPFLGHQQIITGPIVNAALFVAVAVLSIQNALFVGLLPSIVALSAGLLPAVLAPMVPFIMAGNAILIIIFYYFKNRNFWLAISLAAFLKFLWLFSTSSIVIHLVVKKELAQTIALMMSWPQLFTALIGGFVAFFVLKILKTKNLR